MNMRRIYAVYLLGLYALMMCHSYVPYLNFKLNQDYIVANLCQERNAIKNTCQGSCHLKMMLDEQEVQTQRKPIPPIQFIDQLLHTVAHNFTLTEPSETLLQTPEAAYLMKEPHFVLLEIPIPPPEIA